MNESKEQLETLLSDYVDGNLTGGQLASVESYLDANPGVRDAVNRLMIDSEALRSLPRVTAPFDFSEDVRGQLERDLLLDGTQVSFPRRRRISSFVATAAAMLIIFVGIGGGAYWILSNRPAPFLDVAMNSPEGPAEEVDRATKPEESPKLEEVGRIESERSSRTDTGADSVTKSLALNEPTASTPAAIAAPVLSDDGFIVRSNDDVRKSVAMRRESFAKQAPDDVVQLVDEAPRYNRRAIAIVIDAKDAGPAKAAVNDYLAFNSVRSQALSYDAARNRALRPEREGAEAIADSSQQLTGSQVSGVLTNSAESPVTQAMGGASAIFAGGVPSHPQVVLAIGLTDTQVDDLHSTLLKDIGSDHAQAFELGDADSLRLLQSANADLSKNLNADRDVPAAAEDQKVATSQPTILATGDALVITLIDPDASNLKTRRDVTIDASGDIELPQLDKVRAAGMTLQALRASIVSQYIDRKLVRDPLVNIELATAADSVAKKSEEVKAVDPLPTSKDGEKSLPAGDGTFADKEKMDAADADLLDVFIVLRGQSPAIVNTPATQPATPAEAQPATKTTQPTQPQ